MPSGRLDVAAPPLGWHVFACRAAHHLRPLRTVPFLAGAQGADAHATPPRPRNKFVQPPNRSLPEIRLRLVFDRTRRVCPHRRYLSARSGRMRLRLPPRPFRRSATAGHRASRSPSRRDEIARRISELSSTLKARPQPQMPTAGKRSDLSSSSLREWRRRKLWNVREELPLHQSREEGG